MRGVTQEMADRLLLLEKRGGRLDPSAVVEDAKDPTSPLHSWAGWTWDVEAAAEERWLDQSRQLIRLVRFVSEDGERTLRVPTYIRDHDRAPKEEGYIRTMRVAKDEDRARRAIEREMNRAIGYVVRVRTLASYFGLEDELREIEDRLFCVRGLIETS
jgi:hypothetical protein